LLIGGIGFRELVILCFLYFDDLLVSSIPSFPHSLLLSPSTNSSHLQVSNSISTLILTLFHNYQVYANIPPFPFLTFPTLQYYQTPFISAIGITFPPQLYYQIPFGVIIGISVPEVFRSFRLFIEGCCVARLFSHFVY
jgi:hypothetical protein